MNNFDLFLVYGSIAVSIIFWVWCIKQIRETNKNTNRLKDNLELVEENQYALICTVISGLPKYKKGDHMAVLKNHGKYNSYSGMLGEIIDGPCLPQIKPTDCCTTYEWFYGFDVGGCRLKWLPESILELRCKGFEPKTKKK